jgi:hypothetical protein
LSRSNAHNSIDEASADAGDVLGSVLLPNKPPQKARSTG